LREYATTVYLSFYATKSHTERRKRFETSSGIDLPADFNPSNTDPVDYHKDLNCPATFLSRAAFTQTCIGAGYGPCGSTPATQTAEESNARYKYLLAQGTTGLSVAFDLPTQIGLDSDDPTAAGEVGKVGVAMTRLMTCCGF